MKLSRLFASVLLFFLPLCAVGCSRTAKEFDPEAFAKEMLAGGAFSDELTKTEAGIGCHLYGISEDKAEAMYFYFSSGATAEEMAIFKTSGKEEDVKSLADAMKNRVERQKNVYESYASAEVPKLDKAVIGTAGPYLVLYVASDYDAARKVAEKYLDS